MPTSSEADRAESKKADILFLGDSQFDYKLPELALAMLRDNYRVIIPNFANTKRIKHTVSVDTMVIQLGSILRDLRQRDPLVRSMPSPTLGVTKRRASLQSTSLTFAESDQQPCRFSLNNIQPIRPVLKRPPVFLLGVGFGGLVASQYMVVNNLYTQVPQSRQFPDMRNLFRRLFPSVNAASTSSSKHRVQASIGLVPHVSPTGCVLVSPLIDGSLSANVPRAGKLKHLGSSRITTPSRDARISMHFVKENAATIKSPILILHGNKVCSNFQAIHPLLITN